MVSGNIIEFDKGEKVKLIQPKFLMICTSLLFTSCADGPSNEEIKTLLNTESDEVITMATELTGEDQSGLSTSLMNALTPNVTSVTDTDCQKADNDTFNCVATIEFHIMGMINHETKEIRVKKVESNWQLVR